MQGQFFSKPRSRIELIFSGGVPYTILTILMYGFFKIRIMALGRGVLVRKKKFLLERWRKLKFSQNVPYGSLIILMYQIFKIRPTSSFMAVFLIF